MRGFLWLIVPIALCAAASGGAQGRQSEPDSNSQAICIGGPRWRASLAESAAIETVPVPASYRLLFESTAPCTRWALDEASLIDLHLRFGSEQSIVPALAYLERDDVRGEPAPEAYPAALERAWEAAQADLRRAHAIQQPQGANYSAQHRFLEASRPVQRLEALVRTREKYVFLATQYLRAAEEFNALAMLDAADRYLAVALAGGRFLAPRESEAPVAGLLYFNLHTFVTDDLEMRAALLRAGVTRNGPDIARAEAIVQAKERPYYPRLAETAFSGGDDFCDISDGYSQAERLAETCRADDADDDAQDRVVNQLLGRAMLDVIAGRESVAGCCESNAIAFRLLAIERLPDRGRCCLRDPVEDIVRLRRARADFFYRRPNEDAFSNWYEALGELQAAERLIEPDLAPSRLRRIATSWLHIWDQRNALFEGRENGSSPDFAPELRRYASYLRHLLASLDPIAAGAETDLRTQVD